MSDHVPFPEDDRSRTPHHGDALLRAAFDQKHGVEIDLTVADEIRVATLGVEIGLVDSCPACWQRTFCDDAPPCARHDDNV